MRLLRCIESLDPALGGVQEAVRQACLGLPGIGHSVEVVCLDDPGAPWLQDYPAVVHALGPARASLRGVSMVPYSYSGRFLRWMRANATEYDAVIIEGLWQFISLGTWLALRKSSVPYFVIPHNMLDPWFKHRYPLKHLKKWLYWIVFESWVLRDARAVLYLSESERVLARKAFRPYRVKGEVSLGLAIGAPPQFSQQQRTLLFEMFPELENKRLLLYMSRLHPLKGCDLLLEAFAKVARKDPRLHLVFAGPDPVGWRQELQRQAQVLGLEPQVTWAGMLTGDVKWGAIRCSELFVLPSHGEGFPVAVVEAMACGLPVLISDKVGIWREIYETGGALVTRDNVEGTTQQLENWLQLPPGEREEMKRKVAEGYVDRFAPFVVNKRFISALRDLGVEDSSARESNAHQL